MLLRASRASGNLTKEALFGTVGRGAMGFARGVVKSQAPNPGLVGKIGYGAGRVARKAALPLAGAGMVAASVAPTIAEGVQKSRVGLSPQYVQAQKYNLAPQLRSGTGI